MSETNGQSKHPVQEAIETMFGAKLREAQWRFVEQALDPLIVAAQNYGREQAHDEEVARFNKVLQQMGGIAGRLFSNFAGGGEDSDALHALREELVKIFDPLLERDGSIEAARAEGYALGREEARAAYLQHVHDVLDPFAGGDRSSG